MSVVNQEANIKELFIKYLDNRCTPDEIRLLLNYYDNLEHEDVLKDLIIAELGRSSHDKANEVQTEIAVKQVRSSLIKEIKNNNHQSSEKVYSISYWFKLCAIWLLFLGIGTLFIKFYSNEIHTIFFAPKYSIVKTKRAERKIINLSDGSKIWLSPSSSLEYPDQLVGNLREVKLEGEAFFEVAKDKKHPFIIHTGDMNTRVVGTSFDIKSYKSQQIYLVTVLTGIVSVSARTSANPHLPGVILKPNQQSQFSLKSGKLTMTNYPEAISWLKRREGILKYDGAPVQEVINDLIRNYNVQIVAENNSINCLCYGEFNVNEPVDIVLKQLAAAINANVISQKGKYILVGGCGE